MLKRGRFMLVFYAVFLLGIGAVILLLLLSFSINVLPEDSEIYQACPAFFDWFRVTMGSSLYQTLLVFLFGTVLFLMGYSILKILISRGRKAKFISIRNSLGEIRISLAAVEEFIQKCGVKIEEVRDVRSKIKTKKSEVRVYSRVSIWAGSNVPDIADNVQEKIRKSMEELLGVETKVRVYVSIDRIMPQRPAKDDGVEAPQGTQAHPYRS
ncbi:alkaline shock response membrane anchor protein AmaP [PVC group bacterium]|nr:alkaline shock response membrane anchor protein AmaP [PVC group bacterium]